MSQKGQPHHFNVSLPNYNITPYTLGRFIDTFNYNNSSKQSNVSPVVIYTPRDLQSLIIKDQTDKAYIEREKQFMRGY